MEKLLALNQFTPEEIQEFISNGIPMKCPKRTILLREGETQRFIYWLTKGVVRAGYSDKKGGDITRTFFTPTTMPFVANYASFIFQTPALSFIETLEDCEMISWHAEYIRKLEATDVKWLRFMKTQIDWIFMGREIKEYQFYTMTSEELYLAFVEQSPELVNSIPQHYIASYLGISPEGLSRIKSRLNTKNKEKTKRKP